MSKGRSVTLGDKADDHLSKVNQALQEHGCENIRLSEALRVALRTLSAMPASKIKSAVEKNRHQEFMNS